MSIGTLLALVVLVLTGLAIVFDLRPGWDHFELILIALLALALLLGAPVNWSGWFRRGPKQE